MLGSQISPYALRHLFSVTALDKINFLEAALLPIPQG